MPQTRVPGRPKPAPAAAPVLSRRALNRALLARQFLLERARHPTLKVLEQLVGLQAQSPAAPYVALWSRVADFDPRAASDLLARRKAARLGLMRSTLHLVSARDARAVFPLLEAVRHRTFQTGSPYGRRLAGIDLGAVLEKAHELLAKAPLTLPELGQALAASWPKRDPTALAQAARLLLPIVQVPPRGLWGESGQARWQTAEAWLGASGKPPRLSVPDLVRRYLGAFGPASVRDAQAWSGLAGLGPIFEALRPELSVFADENGVELFDLPKAPRPAEGSPAPVRFLPEYDNLLLGHADRTRILSEQDRPRLFQGPIIRAAVLIDGFVGGHWKLESSGRTARLRVHLFRPLTRADRAAVEAEGEALLRCLAPDAVKPDVRIA